MRVTPPATAAEITASRSALKREVSMCVWLSMSKQTILSNLSTSGLVRHPQEVPLHFKEGDGCRMDIGRATTRAHPPHPLPTRPYYRTNRPAQPVYRRGRGGCGRGDGALVAARPCPPPHLFSLFERYWPLWLPVRPLLLICNYCPLRMPGRGHYFIKYSSRWNGMSNLTG